MEKPPVSSILVIDSNEQNLMVTQKALQGINIPLVAASSEQAALRLLLQEEFVVILLAIKTQAIPGFELARLIRTRNKTKYNPPCIFNCTR